MPDPVARISIPRRGMSAAVSPTVCLGLVPPVVIEQQAAFDAGIILARSEDIDLAAPQSFVSDYSPLAIDTKEHVPYA